MIVASVGRPDTLAKCLFALARQVRDGVSVLVVARDFDTATQEVAKRFDVEVVTVARAGVAQAWQAGIEAAVGDIVLFVDDDAIAKDGWVDVALRAFSDDPNLGGLGGRDNVNGDIEAGNEDLIVGRLLRGKLYGNHHLGKGAQRPAQHVKGANMAFRRKAVLGLPISEFIFGQGAQYGTELLLSFCTSHRGFGLKYDPSLAVDHFPAKRAEGDDRHQFNRKRVMTMRANEALAICAFATKMDKVLFITRSIFLGSRVECGLLTLGYCLLRGDLSAISRFVGAMQGLVLGALRGSKVAKYESGF